MIKVGMKIKFSCGKTFNVNREKNNFDNVYLNGKPVMNVENYLYLGLIIGCGGD